MSRISDQDSSGRCVGVFEDSPRDPSTPKPLRIYDLDDCKTFKHPRTEEEKHCPIEEKENTVGRGEDRTRTPLYRGLLRWDPKSDLLRV